VRIPSRRRFGTTRLRQKRAIAKNLQTTLSPSDRIRDSAPSRPHELNLAGAETTVVGLTVESRVAGVGRGSGQRSTLVDNSPDAQTTHRKGKAVLQRPRDTRDYRPRALGPRAALDAQRHFRAKSSTSRSAHTWSHSERTQKSQNVLPKLHVVSC
jgi:hypothetical protein